MFRLHKINQLQQDPPPHHYLCRMKKVGILGGGQLGRMLLQAGANYPVEIHVLENDPACPAAELCRNFTRGDIRNFEDVYQFGANLDALTIEIENVNVDALEKLESEGKKVYPRPFVLRTIRNKILQKQFYQQHQVPTAEFRVIKNRTEIADLEYFLPAVNKLAEGGYDGRGVQLIRSREEINQVFPAPGVLEKLVDIDKEIAQLVAIFENGQHAIFPPVEMLFDPVLNQLDHHICPAELSEKTGWKVEAIALSVARNFRSPGLFAVEMFLDTNGNVLVNETAPRVHNSGHHTIEAHYCSQFDMLWRVILDYPPGNTQSILPSVMVNLVGEPGQSGKARYVGMDEVLKIPNTFVHIYGKHETRPGRKMGHVTILSREKQELLHQAMRVKRNLKVMGEG